MIFDPASEAMEFAEAGGTVSLEEWANMGHADRCALRAARETVAKRRAVQIALALQGRLTAGQQKERELDELRRCVEAAARA